MYQSALTATTPITTPATIFAHRHAQLYTDTVIIQQKVVYQSVQLVILLLVIVLVINVFIHVLVALMRRLMLIGDVYLFVRLGLGEINRRGFVSRSR